MVTPFQFHHPVRFVFGAGVLARLGEVCRGHGRRAVVVSGRSMERQGFLEKARGSLREAGIESEPFVGVEENPSTGTVMRGARLSRKRGCDLVVGIGGGSPMDAAKAIAVAATHAGDIWEYVESGAKGIPGITAATLPIVLVPSTAGTGSETTRYAVVTHTGRKIKETVVSDHVFPRVALVDPQIMISAPPRLTALTGCDALGQAIEGLTSRHASPWTDVLAMEAIRLILRSLRRAVARGDDLEARSDMALAASLSGVVISHTGCTLDHAMSHPLTAHTGVPHGLAVAALLGPTLRYNLPASIDKLARLARYLGQDRVSTDRELALGVVSEVERLLEDLRLDLGLASQGVKRSILPRLARETLTMGAYRCNVLQPGDRDVEALFRQAL